ncbi:hypothetical protein ACQKWADRAFT_282601 [Trichoderma austrokoningii]
MSFGQLVLSLLEVLAQALKDWLFSLNAFQFYVLAVSLCIIFTRCIYCVCSRRRAADCGKIGLKFKIPILVFTLKIG